MDNQALSLAKKILNADPKERLSVDKIICQPWMQTVFDNEGDVWFVCKGVLSCFSGVAGVGALAI